MYVGGNLLVGVVQANVYGVSLQLIRSVGYTVNARLWLYLVTSSSGPSVLETLSM